MGVIFIPNHLIWQMQQCAHILILIMHFHTRNVYFWCCADCPCINLPDQETTKKMKKQHPQLGFTFITALEVVLLMVEFH